MPDESRPTADDHESGRDRSRDAGTVSFPAIPGYEFQRRIGRGGSATVYLARELKHDRHVAVKLLHPALAASIQAERFLREIAITARLAHPNILPLLDSGSIGEQLYYVMPFVSGESLRQRLERDRNLAVGDAVRLTREVADALDYAHRQGLVHRDVKPENILMADDHALVADFGIARALSLATDDRLTTSGLALGTPRYMSPEQASDRPLDGRSDVYSLGCVLFELLTGEPPFSGATPQEIVAQHATGKVPSLRGRSPTIPTHVERAVRTALAKRPQERFASAALFASSVEGRSRIPRTGPLGVVWDWIAMRRPTRVATAAVAVGVVSVSTVIMAKTRNGRGGRTPVAAPDTTRLAVFPVAPGSQPGNSTAVDLLYEAIARWDGITLVDQFQVSDALARLDGPITVASTARISASLGAGRYVLVQMTALGDSTRAYATLYGAPAAQRLASASEIVSSASSDAADVFARIARKLLLRDTGDSLLLAGGSNRLPAVQAFGVAQSALTRWNLSTADSAFEQALDFDSRYARATYWLAQVRAWRGLASDQWLSLAERAMSGTGLSDREQALARALTFLGRSSFRESCAVYDSLRRGNARDFAAWYGLGQCHSRDRVVVRDDASPSRWRMRSSYYAAVTAYDKALELLPSAYAGYEHDAFEGLRSLLMVGTRLIPGRGIGADSGQFIARLAQLGDTLALIPFPWQVVTAGGGIPNGHAEALASRLQEFRRLAGVWSAAFPHRAGPKYAVAIALEMSGDARAVDTLSLARRLTTDSTRRAQLAAAEITLRIKFANHTDARETAAIRQLADSLLRDLTAPVNAATLAPLTAVTGRCHRAEVVSRQRRFDAEPPMTVTLAAAVDLHLSLVSMGCPIADAMGIDNLTSLVDREGITLGAEARRFLDVLALHRTALLAASLDSTLLARLARQGDDPLILAAYAVTRRDTATARRQLTRFQTLASPSQGPPTTDVAFPAARLFLAVHDTGAAKAVLDSALLGMRFATEQHLRDHVVVASMIRSMSLRATLAASTGDVRSARRWGRAVAMLWADADPALQDIVRQMNSYARMR